MAPFLPVRHLLQYFRRRLVNHLNAGEIWQAPYLLGQGAVCPLDNLLKAFRICGFGHEANFTTTPSGDALAGYPIFRVLCEGVGFETLRLIALISALRWVRPRACDAKTSAARKLFS